MESHISLEAAKEAGAYIEKRIFDNYNKSILFIISGGSSLAVLEHINPEKISKSTTLVVTDERFTNDLVGNNFLQLQQTIFYSKAREVGVQFISTIPLDNERHEQFAERIQKQIESYYSENLNSYTIGLFGIGEDGHTASIFPTTEIEFNTAYKSDSYYVPVTQPEQKYPFRATVTPSFIEEKINDVVLYAVGSTKCDNILKYMHNKNFAHHEIPALIPAQHPSSILFTDCQTLQ